MPTPGVILHYKNTLIMKKIAFTDRLFVNVVFNGCSLLNVCLSGFSSLKELMQHLHGVLHQYAGRLLTLQLRNSTRGWNSTGPMLFAA